MSFVNILDKIGRVITAPHSTWIYFVYTMAQPSEGWTKWPPFCKRYFLNAFCWEKMFVSWFKFHWNMSPRAQLSHPMITSWHGNSSHNTGPLWPDSTGHKGPMMLSFRVFFVVSLIKLLNIQSSCRWYFCRHDAHVTSLWWWIEIMMWHRKSDKPFPESTTTQSTAAVYLHYGTTTTMTS